MFNFGWPFGLTNRRDIGQTDGGALRRIEHDAVQCLGTRYATWHADQCQVTFFAAFAEGAGFCAGDERFHEIAHIADRNPSPPPFPVDVDLELWIAPLKARAHEIDPR